jgi:hypothetical protein
VAYPYPGSYSTAGGYTSYATSSTTTATLDQTWRNWCQDIGTGGHWELIQQHGVNVLAWVGEGTLGWNYWNTSYEETAEQQAARIEAQREAEAERERQLARQREPVPLTDVVRAAADEIATGLLLSFLTSEQARTYTEHGWFEIRGSLGRRWRIHKHSQAGNVALMPEQGDVRTATYCCHPPGGLPNADAHLAQLLAIVTDEDAFEQTANLQSGQRPPRPEVPACMPMVERARRRRNQRQRAAA